MRKTLKPTLLWLDIDDASHGREPRQYRALVDRLYRDIKKNGFVQKDKRFNRKVWALPGHFIIIKDIATKVYLLQQSLLRKYADDWNRMSISFLKACQEAKKDPNSRQLVVFNDANFDKVHQCFTHMQFVYTARNEFDLYVYQRSADMVKLKDDLTFFAHVGQLFETEVKKKVTKIVVVYGNVHFTKE